LADARSSGVLLHPTSLPGPYGIGDLGPRAHQFIDWLASAGCGLWQVLPLGPTGYGNSPYQCHSVFAGNPYLISPELLVRDGLLEAADLQMSPYATAAAPQPTRVDFGAAIPWKMSILDLAFRRFEKGASSEGRAEFDRFRTENAAWLEDFALFMAMKDKHAGASWKSWAPGIQKREPAAIRRQAQASQPSVARWAFYQMLFFQQWAELRQNARRRGIRLIGDVPIFAAEDSADVWAHPELFCLDGELRPTVVSGVPPDYFAPTGQLWGNPLYDWDVHSRTGYNWWLQRLRAILELVDIVRMDHFRGLAGYWQVPAGARTAEEGRWVPGPGGSFLDTVQKGLRIGSRPERLPVIAEDLGVVTPDVAGLLDKYGLPGMRVLQFGFAGLSEDFLPHNYVRECVAYTGTHDNDTSRGWFSSATRAEQQFALKYLGSTEAGIVDDMIRANWESLSMITIVPLQDVLGLGTESRMNYPGRPQGNWEWRFGEAELTSDRAEWMRQLNVQTGRCSEIRADLAG
jgi:4-alpha-glucanotransferase